MLNNIEEFNYEKDYFEELMKWLKTELSLKNVEFKEIKEKVSSLKKSSGGTFSEELYLNESLEDIAKKTLVKFESSKESPYFARIDFKEKMRDTESFYIGKFSLIDDTEVEEKVIDWRSPIADLYYSGTEGKCFYEAPIGEVEGELSLKRKFLIKDEKLIDAFDEGTNEIIIKATGENEESNLVDEFLRINLEESVSNKLKEVVATIQKEQNNIIRASLNKPMIIQGSAGSGKTTVALHRLAYLLYRHNKFLNGEDILVLAPNKIFLDYISQVLPNLGVDTVSQLTYEELCLKILNAKAKVLNKDNKLIVIIESENKEELSLIKSKSKFKSSIMFKIILDRYTRYIENEDLKIEDIKYGEYILFSSKEMRVLYGKDLRHLPINLRKLEIKKYFENKLKDRLLEINSKIDMNYDEKVKQIKNILVDGESRRKILIDLYEERDILKKNLQKESKKILGEFFKKWINNNIKILYERLFLDDNIFDMVSDNKIPKKLSEYLRKNMGKNIVNKCIDEEDLSAMVYLKFKLDGVKDEKKFKHIVIDEAQDYSIFALNLLKNLSKNNSFTIVGDIGQGIYDFKGIKQWEAVIKDIFKEECNYITLKQSYRSTIEIIDLANRVLEKQENNLKPAKPVLRHGLEPQVIKYAEKKFIKIVDEITSKCKEDKKKSTAIITKDLKEAEEVFKALNEESLFSWDIIRNNEKNIKEENIVIPSYLTKGLEFDTVIVNNCSSSIYLDNELDKKLLYVVLTRALHREYILYREEITSLLQ